MNYYDTSDILTPSARPALRPSESALIPNSNTLFRLSSYAALCLVAWFVVLQLKGYFNGWQERTYRLSMRRRYGIPDDDHRPFNVAYAAARQARLGQGGDTGDSPLEVRSRSAQDNFIPLRRDSFDNLSLRQRSVVADRVSTPMLQSNQGLTSGRLLNESSTLMNDATRNPYAHRPPIRAQQVLFGDQLKGNFAPSIPGSIEVSRDPDFSTAATSRTSRPALVQVSRKRGLDDESDVEVSKRTRMGSRQIIDVDADEGNRMDEDLPQKRGEKRGPSPEEDEGYSSRQEGREKRIRRVSGEDTDYLKESDLAPRGRKRDRGEAGSTFGGDDDYLDVEDLTNSRRRRRRTERKRSDQQLRGTKRDRTVGFEDEDDSDLAESGPSQRKIGRKGEKASEQDFVVDMEDTPVSIDPLCKGRKIGEEWEEDGEHFKVGLNGQRLRQALIKKSRTKFPNMPVDSRHSDRGAAWDIYVEKWVTEDEFKAAENRFELAWQETPISTQRSPDGFESPGNKSGNKNLLWASQSGHDSPLTVDQLTTSGLNDSGTRPNPFSKSRLGAPGRRIASAYASTTFHTPPKLTSSTTSVESPSKKNFSKWEKQDLEAQAMTRMRVQSQERREEERKIAAAATAAAAASATTSTLSAPQGQSGASIFVLPKPADKPASELIEAPAPAASNTPAPSGNSAKMPDAPKPPSFFAPFPAAPAPTSAAASAPNPTPSTPSASSTVPSFSAPTAPAAPASTGANLTSAFAWPPAENDKAASGASALTSTATPVASNFFSTPPKQQTSSGPDIPNFFGPKSASAAPALSTPPSNSVANMDTSTTPAGPPPSKPLVFGSTGASTTHAAPSAPSWGSFETVNSANPTSSSLFGALSEQKKPEEKKAEQAPAPGGSLISRLGGFSQPGTSTFSQASTAPSVNSAFSIPHPETPRATSIFNATPSSSSAQQGAVGSVFGPSSTSSAETTTPKFKFNLPNRSAGASPAPAASEAPKPGGSVFGSSTPSAPASALSVASTSVPKFNFGMTPSSSSAPAGGDAPMATDSGDTVSGGSGATESGATSSVIPSASAAAPSIFGSGNSGTFSAFGNSAASTSKPAATPKLSFNFNTGSQPSSSVGSIFGTGKQPAADTSRPAQGSTPSLFTFPTSTPGASSSAPTEAPKSAFSLRPASGSGASAQPTAPGTEKKTITFGAGFGSQSNAPPSTTSVFGNPTTPSSNQPAPGQASSLFNFSNSSTSSNFTWPPKPTENQK